MKLTPVLQILNTPLYNRHYKFMLSSSNIAITITVVHYSKVS